MLVPLNVDISMSLLAQSWWQNSDFLFLYSLLKSFLLLFLFLNFSLIIQRILSILLNLMGTFFEKIKIQRMCIEFHLFRVYNSVTFHVFRKLCKHQKDLILEYFHYPKDSTVYGFSSHSWISSLQYSSDFINHLTRALHVTISRICWCWRFFSWPSVQASPSWQLFQLPLQLQEFSPCCMFSLQASWYINLLMKKWNI